MFRRHSFFRFYTMLLVLALLSNSVLPVAYAQNTTPLYLPIITNGNAVPQTDLVFRTRITVQTPAQWRDLQRMEVVILEQGADWATVLVDDLQLTDLARWRYSPTSTDTLEALVAAHTATDNATAASFQPLLTEITATKAQLQAAATAAAHDGRMNLRAALQNLSEEQQSFLLAATSVDTDSDGLNDTLEGYWCTDPARADSDFDGANDGTEVQRIKDWMDNKLSKAPSSAKPFQGWPPQKTNCYDDDLDSVPDVVEVLELGLDLNQESTDRDKFDDGQELFGTTYCPGSAGFCGYGVRPRNEDWGTITAQMPSWVKAPGHHPLVAAFPVPEIDVVESSLKVATVTTVTTDRVISKGTQKSYSTAKTEGTSNSLTNSTIWNEWEEVSTTTPLIAAQNNNSNTHIKAAHVQGLPAGFKIAGGATALLAGLGAIALCAGPQVVLCAGVGLLGVAGGTIQLADGFADLHDERQKQTKQNIKIQCQPQLQSCPNYTPISYSQNPLESSEVETQNLAPNPNHVSYTRNTQQQTIDVKQVLQYAPIAPPHPTTTTTAKGISRGGSQSTTVSQYEEHTVTNGEAFSTEESWGTATAVNSAHAADLWFTYKVRNTGTEYSREIGNLAFNIYIGDDPNPAYTYFVAPDIGGSGKFQNFMPDEEHQYTSRRIPLSLEQMKLIDLGAPMRIVVEDFTYGIDELFYQDAANAGILIALEDGVDDGNELIDTYLIPTWGQETVLNVVARYFPHETDSAGVMTAIWTPEYRSDTPAWCQSPRRPTDQPTKVLWCKHTLSTADWWNVYTDGLGDGSEGFQDTQAVPGSVALFRFNKDSDLDGFSDRTEIQLGTDPNDPTSFPHPELLAGVHNLRSGNRVTSTLSLLNSGFYDAYGVEAVMVAPDDSVNITNNTVGGSGRVRALKQVIVGSSLKLQTPLPAAWTQANHATLGVGGYYTGAQDRTYTFTVTDCPNGGCTVGSGTWKLNWSDGRGATGQLAFGANYQSPNFQAVGVFGLTLALYSGNVANGESFTVAARTPRDTFQYTINRQPYTEPLVIVSYNDPQGNHRFVLPSAAMSLTQPTANLQQYAGTMLDDVGVEIVTSRPFTVGVNSATLLVNNPSDKTLQNAHLFLEVINISGTVVAETPVTVTLPPGPTATPITFDTSAFSPAYRPADDYIVMAFLTDYQGNILDTAGRPLSSFQVDPLPQLATDGNPLIWNFGVATQGTLMKYTLPIANTGFGRLYTYLPPVAGIKLDQRKTKSIGAADVATYELIFSTAVTATGRYEQVVTIATNALLSNTLTLQITGQVNPLPETTALSLQKNELALPQQTTQGNTDIFAHNGSNLSRSVANNWLEMIRNGGFETGNLQEWNVGNGEWTIGGGGPRSGGRSVWKQRTDRSANHAWIYQETNVGQWQSYINDGRAEAKVGIWQWNQAGDSRDNGRIKVFYFQGNNTLAAFDSGYVNSQSGYGLLQDTRVIPAGTDRIRLEFWTKREANDYNDVAADDAFMQVLLSEPPTPTPTPTLTPTPTMTPTPTPVATVRYIRVPVATYTSFLLDFTAGSGGTVALDLGDDGTIDWRASLDAPRQLTSNLNDALNSYLAGKSGDVDVPLRFYLAPLYPITLNDYQATIAPTTDLVADSITVSGGTINAGDTVTVNATLRSSNGNSGPVTAAFFATATGWGDWYIGSAFVANVTSSGVPVSVQWNTTGFSGTVPVKVVINPYQRVAETNYNNNRKETSVIVPLPPVLPAAPTGLVATMAATNRINLTWTDASTNESGFKIERSLTGVNGWTQIATAGANVTTYASIGLACGKAYFYRVRSTNSNGDSAFSNVATTLTRLCTPAIQPVMGITLTQLTLLWSDNNSNESGFKIERSASGATPWSQIATVGANVTTYTNSGLTCATPYYYRVRAYTGSNNSAYSAIVNATTTICAPAAPTLLAATAISATQINLSWNDASSNESGFKIERSPDGVNGWTQIATVNAGVTAYASIGLACGKAYFYRVRSTNSNGDSAFSNVATTLTRLCTPAIQPVTGITLTQLTLLWSDNNSNESGFKIERSATGATHWSQIATVGANVTTYTNSGLQCGTPHYYRVRAYNGGNNSAYSAIVNATTTICTPAAPTLLAATAISATQINLSWNDASSNESGFKIERSPDGVNSWTLLTTLGANVTSYANSGLACATTYHYRVRATNAGGDSPASNVANATTPACLLDLIFADGFESGSFSAWSGRPVGSNLRVTATAALAGSSQGMAALMANNTGMYITDQRPNAEPRYRTRFYFDPNTITMTSGDAHFIFYGYQGTTTVVLRIEFRRLNSSYQLRFAALNDTPTTGAATWRTSSYVTISDAPHFLELDWQAATAAGANNGSLTFWIDGIQRTPLTGLDNDTRRIDIARLGPIGGLDTGTRGSYYFDAFESRRRSYIGPVGGSALAAELTTTAETLTTTVGTVLATSPLHATEATTLTANVAGLGVEVTLPAISDSGAITVQLYITDTQSLPAGYTLLGDMLAVQSSALVTQPVTMTIAYGIAATGTLTTTVSLQQWNASAEQWEALPAQVNHDAQTITAAINVPATLALWQPETETLPVESVEENGETEETAAPDQFSIYLPLVQK